MLGQCWLFFRFDGFDENPIRDAFDVLRYLGSLSLFAGFGTLESQTRVLVSTQCVLAWSISV